MKGFFYVLTQYVYETWSIQIVNEKEGVIRMYTPSVSLTKEQNLPQSFRKIK